MLPEPSIQFQLNCQSKAQNKGLFMIKQLLLASTLLLTSCVYTLDIQQGNILEQKEVDKLRLDLTKNQVIYVLGNPVIKDSFSDDAWVYLYTFKNRNDQLEKSKKLTLYFKDDKLKSVSGDFEIPKELELAKKN